MKLPRVMAVFENTHAALKAEKILKAEGLDIRTAIKPSQISAGCQMALTMPEASMELAVWTLKERNMRAPRFFRVTADGRWEEAE